MEENILQYIQYVEKIYFYMIFAYVLLSWLPNVRNSSVGIILGKLVEPYLAPFRRFIPVIGGVIDVSPIVALIALQFVFQGIYVIVRFLIPG